MAFRLVFLGMLGSGKSHVAREAARLTGGVVLPFAKDVYRLTEAVLGRRVDKKIPSDRALLKTIGTDARASIQRMLGNHVYLSLQVKVEPKWTERLAGLHKLGYRKDDLS